MISENMRRTYVESRGLPSEKVVTVLDWMDESRFAHLPAINGACAQYGVPKEPFTFLYLGNIGPVAGVDHLIKAFHAAHLSHAQLIIAGDGSAKVACVALAKSLNLSKVRFDSYPRGGMSHYSSAWPTSAFYRCAKGRDSVPFPPSLLRICFRPNRFLPRLTRGATRLVAFGKRRVGGWANRSESIGLRRRWPRSPSVPSLALEEMGQGGRRYGLKHFSKVEGASRLVDIILSSCRRNEKEDSARSNIGDRSSHARLGRSPWLQSRFL